MSGRVEVRGLGRDYDGNPPLTVLSDIDFVVEPGEFFAITGPSGSGKSTLLGLIAGLDRPTRGEVSMDGTSITNMSEEQLSTFRGHNVGFVFQSFQLISTLSALENVRVVADLLDDPDGDDKARKLLERVGLSARLNHYPAQLSGGEMQRVAIARASIARPALLLADEPTGNLDSESGEEALQLLLDVNRDATLILVTHDATLAARADREARLKDGRLVEIIDRSKPAGRTAPGSAAPGSTAPGSTAPGSTAP